MLDIFDYLTADQLDVIKTVCPEWNRIANSNCLYRTLQLDCANPTRSAELLRIYSHIVSAVTVRGSRTVPASSSVAYDNADNIVLALSSCQRLTEVRFENCTLTVNSYPHLLRTIRRNKNLTAFALVRCRLRENVTDVGSRINVFHALLRSQQQQQQKQIQLGLTMVTLKRLIFWHVESNFKLTRNATYFSDLVRFNSGSLEILKIVLPVSGCDRSSIVQSVAECSRLKRLAVKFIHGFQICPTERDIDEFGKLQHLEDLTILNAYNNSDYFNRLFYRPLRQLKLGYSQKLDDDFLNVLSTYSCHSLRKLNLHGQVLNGITETGLREFLSKCRNLTKLYLFNVNCDIGTWLHEVPNYLPKLIKLQYFHPYNLVQNSDVDGGVAAILHRPVGLYPNDRYPIDLKELRTKMAVHNFTVKWNFSDYLFRGIECNRTF